jgi:dipeptidyl aminopeptidase/acylaminoacyl peptidase
VLTAEQQARDSARAPLATSIVEAYPNSAGMFAQFAATFSPDGKRYLFGSMRDGLPEIYEGDPSKPGDAPRAVTTGPQRAVFATYTRDGKSVLFMRDDKGDEMPHVWRVGVDGSGLADLTPGEPMRRGEPLLPRGKPDTMVYGAFRPTSPHGLVFVQKIAGGEPRLAYESSLPGGPRDVSDDGARVLFTDLVSFGNQVLQEVDLSSGKAHRLYPPEGKEVTIHSASYATDGRRVFVTTDEGGDGSVLLALDARTGKELGRYVQDSPPTARLFAAASPRGDRIALAVDAGTHGELRVVDARTLKLQRAIQVPLGELTLGDWKRDGSALTFLLSQPDRPADPFVVDAATGAVTALRSDKRAGLDALPPLQASTASAKGFDGLTIPINVYLPKMDPGAKARTLIIFHGGPATSYAVRWSPYARFFVSLGYAVLEPNVRGSSGFGRSYEHADDLEKRADWLKDLETVNAWAKSQPWCDSTRVVVWGQSYGGYTTLMALTRQPALWRAGVDLYGPADLAAFMRTTTPLIRSVFVTEFGDPDKNADVLERFSPIRDVNKITSPLFVYQGQNDPRVPRTEGDAIVLALRKRSVPVEYMVAPNEGHAVDRRENKIELLTRTARFLEDALR